MSRQEGETFAYSNGLIFFETSARDRINVDPVFQTVVEKTLEKINNGQVNLFEEVME